MARPKVTLFVDTVSPFAYMAFYALQNFTVFQQCEVTYVPIFLGGLMNKCGNTPPIQIKNKDKWINLERLRWAKVFDIPMTDDMPEGFPPITLHTQRALTALYMEKPEMVSDALAAIYHAFWVDKKPIAKPEVVAPLLAKALGTSEADAQALFKKGGSPDAKAVLVKNTDAAFEDGAFGLPWFVATNPEGKTESFWGFDHLGQVIDHLGLDRPTNNRGWKAML